MCVIRRVFGIAKKYSTDSARTAPRRGSADVLKRAYFEICFLAQIQSPGPRKKRAA